MSSHGDCSICTDISADENPICVCENCSIKVHVLCYGIENSKDSWKCSPCNSGITEPVCKLCTKKNGAFKKTGCGGFVHVICALFTEGVSFEDVIAMEPVNLNRVPNSMRNKECAFCFKSNGFSPHCSKYKCNNRIHITCAQKNGCLREEQKSDGSIKFRAFCRGHKPGATARRISSVSVGEKRKALNRDAMKNATSQRKRDNEKSSTLNSDWIKSGISDQNQVEKTRKRKSDENTVLKSDNVEITRRKVARNVRNATFDMFDSIDALNCMEFNGQRSSTHGISGNASTNSTANDPEKEQHCSVAAIGVRSVDCDSAVLTSLNGKDEVQSVAGKENVPYPRTEFHLCFKDDKISKVSVLLFFHVAN